MYRIFGLMKVVIVGITVCTTLIFSSQQEGKILKISTPLEFGDVKVGESLVKELTLLNEGDSDLTIYKLRFHENLNGVYHGEWSGIIPPNSSKDINITFSPSENKAYDGLVYVESDRTNSGDYDSLLRGVGVDSIATDEKSEGSDITKTLEFGSPLDFSTVKIGSTSTQSLLLKNSGNTPLTIYGFRYHDRLKGAYSGNWSGLILAGESKNVSITFSPNSAEEYTGLVYVESDRTNIEKDRSQLLTGQGEFDSSTAEPQILKAFPTAEGSGAKTVGGRGGRVIEVTNLNASGAGSFKEACEAEGKRTIVFRVGGTIDLNGAEIIIRNDYLTIAGQTAPGEGIQLKNGGISIRANEVIVRYLRIRPGPADTMIDALNIVSPSRHDRKKNVIIDHVSAFWGVDETMNGGSFFNNVTLQWSIIAEGLHCSIYDNAGVPESWAPCTEIDGTDRWAHSRGSMVNSDSRDITYHHNLLYRNYKRNPLIQSSDGNIINNVIVNYQYQVFIEPFEEKVRANFIGNYFRSYLHIRPPIRVYDLNKGYDGQSGVYYKDNYDSKFRPNSTYAENSIRILHQDSDAIGDGHVEDKSTPYTFDIVKVESVEEAYTSVLNKVGANYPKRDSADERVIAFVSSGKAPSTLINDPSEVGGWPIIKGGIAPIDSDHDGMPDSWEQSKGLNLSDGDDGNSQSLSDIGYTNLEIYLNELVQLI